VPEGRRRALWRFNRAAPDDSSVVPARLIRPTERRPNASRLSRSWSSLSVLQQRVPGRRHVMTSARPTTRRLPICIIAYSWRCDLRGRLSVAQPHAVGLNLKLAFDVVAAAGQLSGTDGRRLMLLSIYRQILHCVTDDIRRLASHYVVMHINIVLSLANGRPDMFTRRKYTSVTYISRSAYT